MSTLTVSLIIKAVDRALAPIKAITKGTQGLSKATAAATAPTKAISQAADGLKKATAGATAPVAGLKRATDDLGQAQVRAERRTTSLAARLRLASMRTREWRAALGRGLGSALWLTGGAIGGLSLGAAGLAGKLFSVTLEAAKNAKHIRNAAQSAGLATGSYQRLQYAVEASGVEGVELDDVLKALNKNVIQAARGSKEPRIAFRALGVEFMKTRKSVQPTDVVLGRIADRFAKLPDAARKSQLATMLFGAAGAELIPLLNKGSKGLKDWGDEAQRLGLVMSDQQLLAGEKVNTQWLTMIRTLRGLRNIIATQLFPVFSQFTGWLLKILQNDRQKILDGINKGVATLKDNLPGTLKVLRDLWAVLGFVAAIGAKVIGAIGGVSGVFDWLAGILAAKLAIGLVRLTMLMWGVNGAFWAFPGTWIIAAVVGVAFAGLMLKRHWGAVSAFFGGLFAKLKSWFTGLPTWAQALISMPLTIIAHWGQIMGFFSGLFSWLKTTFKTGVDALWNSLPAWFKGLLKGSALMLKVAAAPFQAAFGMAAGLAPPRASGAAAPNAAVGRGGEAKVNGTIRIKVDQDGQARVTEAKTSAPGLGFDLSRGPVLAGY